MMDKKVHPKTTVFHGSEILAIFIFRKRKDGGAV
jgi:hypothetical protein